MPYLMESARESERLWLKSDAETSKQQLIMTGLKPGMIVLDAGGGAGFVTRIMSEIVGSTGEAILADLSEERLKVAKEQNRDRRNIAYIQGPLENLRISDNSIDFIFCRFVFEYLNDPSSVMNEFVRICKPGGKIVVGDLDYNMLSHYPISPRLESQIREIISKLEQAKMWDPYAGRKLYHWFSTKKLSKIKVHMLPHHLIYGEAQSRDTINWAMKIDQMEELSKKGVLQFSFDINEFRNEFMKFFENPHRFSYSPLFLVEAHKPRR